ncbi:MAG: imidazole glycerol phosphate synthase subunit HisF [Elusimicrobiota bacterium]|nr:MAG: imidazole glycerol phosphate synthase subunit HisF [Elusimicrobiota bacterium]
MNSQPPARARVRIIPRLDIKGPNIVKGVHLEGLRVVGDPAEHARRYYEEGADELLYMDIVASLYGRNNLLDIVERAAADIFIPLTVGGGVRKLDDVYKLLRAGADKVAVNTAAIANPEFIREAARSFGSQCIVVSIEAKLQAPGRWEALTDNGREKTGVDAYDWARRAADLGAGEILVTSVDREGTLKGFDLDLTAKLATAVSIPVIACGGAGGAAHVLAAVTEGRADAVSVASILHFKKCGLRELKETLLASGVSVRRPPEAAPLA